MPLRTSLRAWPASRFPAASNGCGAYPVSVIVDYAHTPTAWRTCCAARALGKGRLILLFGVEAIGTEQSARAWDASPSLADFVIVTSDNRSEDPETICEEIEAGMRQVSGAPAHWERVVDRRKRYGGYQNRGAR